MSTVRVALVRTWFHNGRNPRTYGKCGARLDQSEARKLARAIHPIAEKNGVPYEMWNYGLKASKTHKDSFEIVIYGHPKDKENVHKLTEATTDASLLVRVVDRRIHLILNSWEFHMPSEKERTLWRLEHDPWDFVDRDELESYYKRMSDFKKRLNPKI